MEHSVHVASGKVIEGVSPTSHAKLVTKLRNAIKRARNEADETDLDKLDLELANMDLDQGDGDNSDDEEIDAGDAVGKALALVKQVCCCVTIHSHMLIDCQIRKSPQARAFFKKSCDEADVPFLQLITWIRTRWASLYSFLDRILQLQKAINRFVQLADDSEEVPDLVGGKGYSDFKLMKKDWEQIEKVHEVLKVLITEHRCVCVLISSTQEPATATQSFSSSRYPTVSRTIPVLEFLQQSWENMAKLPKFREMRKPIEAGLENLKKWYCRVDDTDVYFVCLGKSVGHALMSSLTCRCSP